MQQRLLHHLRGKAMQALLAAVQHSLVVVAAVARVQWVILAVAVQ